MRKILLISLLFASLTTQAATYYLSPSGSDAAAGTIGAPFWTLEKAWTVVAAGDIVYMRGGTYYYTEVQILLGVNGAAGNTIKVLNYPGESPVITRAVAFSYLGAGLAAGVLLSNCDYIDFKGIKISGFYQEEETSVYSAIAIYDCNYCTFERLDLCYNGNGFDAQVGAELGTGNLWYNCDMYRNYDPITRYDIGGNYGNADGIGIESALGSVNTIRGCRFWNNSDDGIDVWQNNGHVYIDSCWVWKSGFREDGITPGGDGNGIKLGDGTVTETGLLRTLTNNIIYYNRRWGVIDNEADCLIELYNNTSSQNGEPKYNGGSFRLDHSGLHHFVKNNISYLDNWSPDYGIGTSRDNVDHNSWEVGGLTAGDFVSLDSTGLSSSRQSNGNLPLLNFLHLITGSNMIDAGVDVGIAYELPDPDLGAFEYVTATPPVPPTVTTSAVADITRSTATGVGNVTASGSNPTVVARGVCWSESPTPTIDDAYSNATVGGLGAFTALITGLSGNTIYYVRAWASNGIVAYGNEVTFTTPISELYRTKDGKLIRDTNGILIRK